MKFDKVFLVGLPGSGKTTLGRKIAQEQRILFVDLDEEIIKVEGQSIATIFESKGEDYFREVEHNQLKNVIAAYPRFVLATGGGTPCFHDNMELMNENGLTIHLDTPLKEVEERLKNDTSRPLLRAHKLEELSAARQSWYRKAKASIIDPSDLREVLD